MDNQIEPTIIINKYPLEDCECNVKLSDRMNSYSGNFYVVTDISKDDTHHIITLTRQDLL